MKNDEVDENEYSEKWVQYFIKLLDLINSRLVRNYFKFFYVYAVTLLLWQSFLFIYEFNLMYFAQFSSSYLNLNQIFLSAAVGPSAYTHFKPLFRKEREKLGKINVSLRVQKKLNAETISFMIYAAVNCLLGICTGFCFSYLNTNNKNSLFMIHLFHKYFPKWATFLSNVYYAQTGIFSVIFMYPIYVWSFSGLLVSLETQAFVEMVKNLEPEMEDGQNNSIFDKKLVKCIKRHIEMSKNTRKGVLNIEKSFPIFLVNATFCLIANLAFYFLFYDIIKEDILSVIFLYIWFGMVFGSIFYYAQKLNDVAHIIFDAVCTIKWYHFSKYSKKNYLIWLENSLQPFHIKLSDSIVLNYPLGLRVAKATYSGVCVFYQLQVNQ